MDFDIADTFKSIILEIDERTDDENIAEESYKILVQFNKYLEEEEINSIALGSQLILNEKNN